MKSGSLQLDLGAALKNFRPEVLDADPALQTLVANQTAVMWYNSTDRAYKYFDGAAIKLLQGSDNVLLLDGSKEMTGTLLLKDEDLSAAPDNAAVSKKFVLDQKSKTYVLDTTGVEAATTHTFEHNSGYRFGAVSVYDENGIQLVPDAVTMIDDNSLKVDLAEATKVFIAFAAGSNEVTTLEPPVVPVAPYTILASEGLIPLTTTQLGAYVILSATDITKVKSVAWSRTGQKVLTNMQGGTDYYAWLYLSGTSSTAWPEDATVTCTITQQDDTVVVITKQLNMTGQQSLIRLGQRRSAPVGSQVNTGASCSLKSGEGAAISISDDNGNIVTGSTASNATRMALLPGESITSVDWSTLGTLAISKPLWRQDRLTIAKGTNPFRVNVVAPTFADSDVGASTALMLIAKITLSTGRFCYVTYGVTLYPTTSSTTTYSALQWAQAQLDAAPID